jgi:hypothetical protein
MLDCVYICRSGPNEELRYSIRSVVKNLPHANIWLIGSKPDWYDGNFVAIENIGDKYDNIDNCLLTIPKISAISDDFISVHDDFFVIKPVDFLINFHGGMLEDRINVHQKASPVSKYTKLLKKTNEILKLAGIRIPLDFDIHVPMIMNKKKLSELRRGPVLLRSMYGNLFNVPSFEMKDVKSYQKGSSLASVKQHNPKQNDLLYFSTEDGSFNDYKNWLEAKFPNPTKYEIDKRQSV